MSVIKSADQTKLFVHKYNIPSSFLPVVACISLNLHSFLRIKTQVNIHVSGQEVYSIKNINIYALNILR